VERVRAYNSDFDNTTTTTKRYILRRRPKNPPWG
jgi:hypothetical protein